MIYNYDYDIAAIILYILVALSYLKTKHFNNAKTKIFRVLLVSSMLTPILDIAGGQAIILKAAPIWTYLFNLTYFLMEQVTNFCFFLYVIAQLEMWSRMSKLRRFLMLMPFLLIAFVIFTNCLHGLVFTYKDRIYQSGPFRIVIVGVPLIYFAWIVIYELRHRHAMKRSDRAMLYAIALINSSARILQYFESSLLIYCYSLAICILILYMYSEKDDKCFDSETGLGNRTALEESIQRLVYNRIKCNSVFVRIADYDLITTSYGIQTAEKYMTKVAQLIAAYAQKNHAYQVSKNCFVINVYEKDNVDDIKNEIYEALKQPWNINGLDIVCSYFITSISYKNCPDYDTFIALLTYFQKMHGQRYGLVPFEELKIKDKARESQVERAVERAILDKSFEVYYQPICTTVEKKFITAEALVRLNDPDLGMISPAEFIPLAESNGTISAIGNIVLDKVCEFIEKTNLEELGLEYIEMNLSTTQCLQRNFISTIDAITSAHGVKSDLLSFEITETASNCAPILFTENLNALRERGYRLALDDFGTGYANLQRLITSDFDIIKFDKEMTQRTCNDEKLHGLFEKLQNMFHSMDAKVVAEGVETEEQYLFFKEIGCDYIQGYYFSKALPESEFIEFMRTH